MLGHFSFSPYLCVQRQNPVRIDMHPPMQLNVCSILPDSKLNFIQLVFPSNSKLKSQVLETFFEWSWTPSVTILQQVQLFQWPLNTRIVSHPKPTNFVRPHQLPLRNAHATGAAWVPRTPDTLDVDVFQSLPWPLSGVVSSGNLNHFQVIQTCNTPWISPKTSTSSTWFFSSQTKQHLDSSTSAKGSKLALVQARSSRP